MKTFKEYVEQRLHLKVPEHDIPGTWFHENNLPMIVRCSCCDMTMALPSALIDDDDYVYCPNCAGE